MIEVRELEDYISQLEKIKEELKTIKCQDKKLEAKEEFNKRYYTSLNYLHTR